MLSYICTLFFLLMVSKCRAETVWICESGDSNVLGEYVSDPDTLRDGSSVYTNQNEMSLFRNSGLWYLGNLNNWPPDTHYRCDDLDTCGYNENIPPTDKGIWTIVKRFGKAPAPVVSSTACSGNDEL